jgi:uncharacterized protein with HEPN domain
MKKHEGRAQLNSRSKLSAHERETAFLMDIQEEASNAISFTRGKNFVEFASDKMLTRAVLMCLASISETCNEKQKHISEALKKRHPEIEWKKMGGFRNVAVHAYFDIDYGIVWDVVKSNLSKLLDVVNMELANRIDPSTEK